jgi:hypothetical protein
MAPALEAFLMGICHKSFIPDFGMDVGEDVDKSDG